MTFSDRLNILLDFLKMNQTQFGNILNISQNNINRYLHNKSKPTIEFFEIIAVKFPEINVHWLISGRGNLMLSGDNRHNIEEEHKAIDDATMFLFTHIYKRALKYDKVADLQSDLMKLEILNSLETIYKYPNAEQGFWNNLLNTKRLETTALILLKKAIKKALKAKKLQKIKHSDAKNNLINILEEYDLTLLEKARYIILPSEQKSVLEYVKNNITELDAYIILTNTPEVLKKIDEHLKVHQSFTKLLVK